MKLRITLILVSILAAGPIAAAESAAAEKDRFVRRARQLTFSGKRAGEGYFSLDGKRLVFQSERQDDNPFFQIYQLDLETGDSRRLSNGVGKTTCAYYVGATEQIIFASTHHDPQSTALQEAEFEFRASGKERRYDWDFDPQMEIYATVENGPELRRLTRDLGYDAEASVSPDGRRIVFTSNRSGYEGETDPERKERLETDPAYYAELYIMNRDGSSVNRLTNSPGYDGGPFFTHDGKRIVWRRFDESGLIADVWSMNTDGTDQQRITDFGCMSWAPFPHPSGEYLIFTSNKLGFSNFELFIVDTAGTHEPVQVTFTKGFDGLPVFSPDGRGLSWTTNRRGAGAQIFLADWDHQAAVEALAQAPPRTQPSPAEGSE